MIKKTIAYKDFDGNQRQEILYFNFTKAELLELEISQGENGLDGLLKQVTETQNAKRVLEIFKDILKRAFGRRQENGTFVKDPQDFENFTHSEAYSELFLWMLENPEDAATFIRGMMPEALQEEKTSAQIREASAAQMQGYKQPTAPTFEKVQEPTVTHTSKNMEPSSGPKTLTDLEFERMARERGMI